MVEVVFRRDATEGQMAARERHELLDCEHNSQREMSIQTKPRETEDVR